MAVSRTNTLTIRFDKDDPTVMDDFYDRLEATGSDNKSAFALQLISQAMYPADPIQGATIQALLRDIKDASGGIQADLRELKEENIQSRKALAHAVSVLLHKIAKQPIEETKRWVNKHIMRVR
jgi:hypothetical protein